MVCACQSNKSNAPSSYTVVIPGQDPIAYSSVDAANARAKMSPGAYVVPSTQPA